MGAVKNLYLAVISILALFAIQTKLAKNKRNTSTVSTFEFSKTICNKWSLIHGMLLSVSIRQLQNSRVCFLDE